MLADIAAKERELKTLKIDLDRKENELTQKTAAVSYGPSRLTLWAGCDRVRASARMFAEVHMLTGASSFFWSSVVPSSLPVTPLCLGSLLSFTLPLQNRQIPPLPASGAIRLLCFSSRPLLQPHPLFPRSAKLRSTSPGTRCPSRCFT